MTNQAGSYEVKLALRGCSLNFPTCSIILDKIFGVVFDFKIASFGVFGEIDRSSYSCIGLNFFKLGSLPGIHRRSSSGWSGVSSFAYVKFTPPSTFRFVDPCSLLLVLITFIGSRAIVMIINPTSAKNFIFLKKTFFGLFYSLVIR